VWARTARDKPFCVNGHRRAAANLVVRSNGTRDCRLWRKAFDRKRNRAVQHARRRRRLRHEAQRRVRPSFKERAWAAGCFDGEGTVTFGGGGTRGFHQAYVTVTNTDQDVTDFYVTRWGGRVRCRKRPSQRSRIPYEWRAQARDMRWFLRDILPLVQRKIVREKIQLVLRVERSRVAAPKASSTRQLVKAAMTRMRKLNHRGC